MRNRQMNMQKHQPIPSSWTESRLMVAAAGQSRGTQWQAAPTGTGPVLRGQVLSNSINGDWQWHYARAVAERKAQVSFEVPAGLTLGLVFEHELKLKLANKSYLISAHAGAQAFCFTSPEPIKLTRFFLPNSPVHKFTFGIRRAWLNSMHLNPAVLVQPKKLLIMPAGDDIQVAVQRLLEAGGENTFERRLQQIQDVNLLLQAFYRTFSMMPTLQSAVQEHTNLDLEQKLLAQVREFIDNDSLLLEELQVTDIAKRLGSSASGIQRLAKKCFGTSLLQYIRHEKLAEAYRALSQGRMTIGQSAFLAGYKHPSNFALAFKRAYGVAPGEVLKAQAERTL